MALNDRDHRDIILHNCTFTTTSSNSTLQLSFEPPPCGHQSLKVTYNLNTKKNDAHCVTCGKRAYTTILTDRAAALITLVQDIFENDADNHEMLLRCWLDICEVLADEKKRLTALIELMDMMRDRVQRQVLGGDTHVPSATSRLHQRDEQDALGAEDTRPRAVA